MHWVNMNLFWSLLISSLIVLAACSGYRAGNSGELVTDKRRGTQKSYTVMGRRYTPLLRSDGFTQSGLASWYGKDFHGKATSNGETYNMHAITAAHKTLPMNVFVEVTSKTNGRKIVVRVNDRGPFVRGRIIDLSYAAARKIGIDRTGTAPVRIRALGYRERNTSGGARYRKPVSYDSGSFTVQVGAFAVHDNARRLSFSMRKYHRYVDIRRTLVNGEFFYRVFAGKYTSLTKAETAAKRFENSGYPGSFVVALD